MNVRVVDESKDESKWMSEREYYEYDGCGLEQVSEWVRVYECEGCG